MVLHEEIRSDGEVWEGGAEDVLGRQDSGEVCGWSGRWVQDVGGIMIFVCDCNGQVARRDQAGVSVDYDVCKRHCDL